MHVLWTAPTTHVVHQLRPPDDELRRIQAAAHLEAVTAAAALAGVELAIDGDDLRALGTGTLTPG